MDNSQNALPDRHGHKKLGEIGSQAGKMAAEACSCYLQDCPGHFGHIELAKPMFHVGYIRQVVTALRCVSYHTSKLLIDPVRLAPLSWAAAVTPCCSCAPGRYCQWASSL